MEASDSFEFGRVKMGLKTDASRGRKNKRKESKDQLLAKVCQLLLESCYKMQLGFLFHVEDLVEVIVITGYKASIRDARS